MVNFSRQKQHQSAPEDDELDTESGLSNHSIRRKDRYVVFLCFLFGIGVFFSIINGMRARDVAHPSPVLSVVQSAPIAVSVIPPLYLKARYQHLQSISLRQADWVASTHDEEDNLKGMQVVMDKVIVIPKVIGFGGQHDRRIG